MKDSKKKKKHENEDDFSKSDRLYKRAIAITIFGVLLVALAGHFLMQQYETAILKVYSSQQDNYVQLVVDQINIQPDRTDEEIISQIIDTLDSGASRFWTLSKNETLLFVKNVIETGLYQGVRTEDFYVSETASTFLDTLTLNRVKHEIILMDNVRYVASGVLFEYQGEYYRICLLTNETVILDNNDFLSTKIDMFIYVLVLILIILFTVLVTENLVHSRQIRILRLNTRIRNLNIRLQEQEKELELINFYDSRWNLYNMHLLWNFLKKFDEKGIKNVTYAWLKFPDSKERKQYLNSVEFLLDDHVMRFDKSEQELVFLFIGMGEPTALRLLKATQIPDEWICELIPMDYDYEGPLYEQMKKYVPEEING